MLWGMDPQGKKGLSPGLFAALTAFTQMSAIYLPGHLDCILAGLLILSVFPPVLPSIHSSIKPPYLSFLAVHQAHIEYLHQAISTIFLKLGHTKLKTFNDLPLPKTEV